MHDLDERKTRGSRDLAWAFVRAVAMGSLAGAGPMMLLTLPLGVVVMVQDPSSTGIATGLKAMFIPLMISTPVVLGSSLLLGIPTFLFLRSRGMETRETYAIVGAVMGIAVTIAMNLVMGDEPGGVFMYLGALAGGVTGWSWWRWTGRWPEEETWPDASRPPIAMTNRQDP